MRPDLTSQNKDEFKIRTFHGRRGRLSTTRLTNLENLVPRYVVPIVGAQHDLRKEFETQEIIIDFGCGMGGHTKQLLHEGKSVLAIDVHTAGIVDLAQFASENSFSLLRLFHGDGKEFLNDEVADETISEVHVYFPDPWPKARHYKRRLISIEFLTELNRILVPGGKVKIVTDIDSYAELVREVIDHQKMFSEVPYLDEVTMTSYHKRALRLGHTIYKYELVKIKAN